MPARPEMLIEQVRPGLPHETVHVNAVRHVADRVLERRHVGPGSAAELGRDAPVDPAHAVDRAGAVQGEPRHVEAVALAIAAELEQRLLVHTEILDEPLEMLDEKLGCEDVVAGRDGRMSREHGIRGDSFEGRPERQTRDRQLAHALEDHERGMALVDVPDGRREAECAQRAHAADAEHGFLLQAQLAAAAVEHVRDVPVRLGVLLNVRVEQQNGHAADARAPDARHDRAARKRTPHEDLVARAVARGAQRRVLGFDVDVLGNLLAVAVDVLIEVALPVQQADRDERQPHVAGGLAMVAGEHAEAPGVDGKALVKAVLGAEVGDEVLLPEAAGLVRQRSELEIGVELGQHLAVGTQKRLVLGRPFEDSLIDAAQEQLGVAVGAAPKALVEPREQQARGGIPAEPEVRGELLEPLDGGRQVRINLKRVDRIRHGVLSEHISV